MPFDTERFITEIQNRPCIWNLSSEEYSNRVLKQSGWNEIAVILYDDWQNLEESTKVKKIKDLQKKWKGLRDYYTREKNKDSSLKSGSGAPKKRKTPYLDMLQFLNVSRASNQTSSNISAETSSNSSTMYDEKKKKMTVFQEALLKSMDKNRESDPDMNFLLNILPEMKTMSPTQNFEFRFEVMKLIKNIKYNVHNNYDGALMQTGWTNANNYPDQYGYTSGSSTPNVQNYPSTSNNYNPVGSSSIRSPRNSPSHSSTGSSVEVEDIEAILRGGSDHIEDDE
ncbi:uncharacterized protein LOC123868198 [Maniola jurtina]|uniref:uncharacterized protein n=1 Tax=Aphantopus hyperantus TaxID=2795564 RepID=UPI00156A08B4|nr:uncharacterized protein LOC117986809 [Maniola hyperantus]XP_034830578.1 uncharacterized protein LOC117987652 [Maniola hyperantus]XP_034831823.1 uncharacterized protein LOC117988753 [Maniola hyperantus]XP_034833878.1 uncharacterized protein LOC117990539 [Maniola hyperantus]XP_034834911.1 uncharacterized protein LOC117991422 [Maniola hyperantus]XP_034837966.1 uncharacterized protein LOC117994186 [Maniola hyperantus]XP_034840991.1 uncharacterized protein LOC117996957 [Maniola hyperantus]XP_0